MTTGKEENIQANGEAELAAADADRIRAIERERIRALVEANIEVAQQLHADDFQLINPGGSALSKGNILGALPLAISSISYGSLKRLVSA